MQNDNERKAQKSAQEKKSRKTAQHEHESHVISSTLTQQNYLAQLDQAARRRELDLAKVEQDAAREEKNSVAAAAERANQSANDSFISRAYNALCDNNQITTASKLVDECVSFNAKRRVEVLEALKNISGPNLSPDSVDNFIKDVTTHISQHA